MVRCRFFVIMLQVSHSKKQKNVLAGSIYLVRRNIHISSFFTHCWHSMNHFLLAQLLPVFVSQSSYSLSRATATAGKSKGEKDRFQEPKLQCVDWKLLPSGPKVCSLVNHYVAPPAVTPLSLFVSMEN